jgi:hypothetical protein
MRILIVLSCSLALAFATSSAQETQQTKEKKKPAPSGRVQAQPGKPVGKPVQAGKPTGPPPQQTGVGKAKGTAQTTKVGKKKGTGTPTTYGKPAEVGKAKGPGKPATAGKAPEAGKPAEASKPTAGKPGTTGVAAGNPLKPQHFNLPKQPNTTKAPPVTFQQGRRIEGSENWQGQNYAVFRNYQSEWHDEGWWHSHYNNIVFVFGAPYFWNAGYWFPAWGYYPNAYYAWDGPIYAYNNLPPDQVIANVQAALQQQGYYHGDVDGLIGPLTRTAIADYQRDHGLYTTSAIDQPTLQSLGMA